MGYRLLHGSTTLNSDGAIAESPLREPIERPVRCAASGESNLAARMGKMLPDFIIGWQHSDVRYFLLQCLNLINPITDHLGSDLT
jgi:hypothetical protein